MNRNYLLTYETEFCISGIPQRTIKTYEWFEDEEEMNDFIEENNIKPIEKFYIPNAESL